jgi:Flp pilus assembly protein TadD
MLVVGLAVTTGGPVAMVARERSLKEQAERWARERRWDQVEAALACYAWYRPRDPAALRLRAQAAHQCGRTEDALRYLRNIPRSSPMYAAGQVQRGSILMDRLRLREAEKVFQACLRYDLAADEAQRRLLGIYGVQRRSGDYNALLWRAERTGLRGLVTLILLAPAIPEIPAKSLVPGAPSEEEALRRWMAADPDDRYVRPLLARVLRDAGRSDEARQLLEPWLHDHPDDIGATGEWVDVLIDQGDFTAAATWLDPIPDPARRSPRFWLLRGKWLEGVGRVAEARASYREAIRLEPSHLGAYLHLRRCLDPRETGDVADR